MRIAIVDWFCHVAGGAEAHLRALLPALFASGHQVALLHGESLPVGETAIHDGLDMSVWRFHEARPTLAVEQLRKWRPDVVYVHSQKSAVLEEALLVSFPVVLFAHNYYGTCGTGTKTFSFPHIEPCGRTFGPVCLALHYPRRCGGLNPATTVRTHWRQRARRKNLPRFRAVLVASRHMHAEFLNHGVAEDRLHLVRLPLTGGVPDALPPSPRSPKGRVLMVARLTKDKGAEYLLHALPIAAERLGTRLELTIAGMGPERESLERQARDLSLNVTFTGWVQPEMRTQLMREADLLAMPSLWPEPFGLVGIEAGCVGLPTAAYASGGVTEWLEPGVTGEIAPAHPPTIEGLADAIVRALANDEQYHQLRRRAWEKSFEFSMAAHLDKVESVFRSIAN